MFLINLLTSMVAAVKMNSLVKQLPPSQTGQKTSNGNQQSAIASAGYTQTIPMAATACAPKEWCLTKTETVTYFENWHQNLMYTLSLDAQFVPFSLDGARWLKRTKNSPLQS